MTARGHAVTFVAAVAVLGCLWLLPAAPGDAAGPTVVTNCKDDGSGTTLRVAIANAGGGTVTFTPGLNCTGAGSGPIKLTGGTLVLSNNVTIAGTGATIAVDGGCTFSGGQCQAGTGVQVFLVNPGVSVGITALTIQHGNGAICAPSLTCGGGIYNNQATLTVTNTTIVNNSADSGSGIENFGTLTVTNSTFSGNSGGEGGAIENFANTLVVTNSTFSGNSVIGSGGAIFSTSNNVPPNATLTVTNSTFSGNSAGSTGGAISNVGAPLTVTNSTFSGNSAGYGGGGIENEQGVAATLTNTIIAQSSGGDCFTPDSTPVTADSHNLADDGSCDSATQKTSAAINLQPLASNGGPTQTFALGPGSAAIDQGAAVGSGPSGPTPPANTVPAQDQRGKPRVGAPDIGAFEVQGFTTLVNSTAADGAANTGGCETGNAGTCRLRDAIAVANGGGGGATPTITFAQDTTVTLDATAGTLILAHDVTIDGAGHQIVVDGNNAVTVFMVNSGVAANFTGLTVRHGSATVVDPIDTFRHGGAIYNAGTLTVSNSTIAGNTAAHRGGGIYSNYGTTTVTGSTFVGNSTGDSGGAIANITALRVTNCTFSGNTATGQGGGIFMATGSTYTVTSSTFSGNTAPFGGSIAGGGGGTLTNNVFAAPGDLGGGYSGSNNLIEDASHPGGIHDDANGNIVGKPALLGTLGSYGGATQTIPLLPGSPAIDAGAAVGQGPGGNPVPATDQRGKPRVGAPDIGAFESQGFSLTKASGDNQSTLVGTAFASPLAVTITANSPGETVAGGMVSFAVPVGGASATFGASAGCTLSNANQTAACTLSGTTAISPTLTANVTAGNYTVTASANGVATPVAFTLTNIAPTITLSPTTLPAGVKGIAYTPTTIGASGTGSTAPYTFAVTAGSLPTGLSLSASGALSGTPTAVGTFTFTVAATDANDFMGTQQYTVSVTATPLISIAVTPANGTLKVGGTQQYTATGTYQDGSQQDLTSQVTWGPAPGASAVVAVDGNGRGTALGPGSATITATQGVISGQTTVTVSGGTGAGVAPVSQPASRPGTAGTPPLSGAPAPTPKPAPTGR